MYNEKGMEIKQAIYYIQPTAKVQHSQVTVVREAEPLTKNIVDISPSRRFGFRIDVDDEGTYDVNVRFNPRRFFGVATGVGKFINNVKNGNLALGGI